MLRKILAAAIILFPALVDAWTTSSGQSLIKLPINRLVTMPTARVMQSGFTDLEFRYEPDGVMRYGIQFGIFPWLTIGISHGFEHYIGTEKFHGQKTPGVLLKYSLCGESKLGPAISLGVDTQGWGPYDANPIGPGKRYLYKAPGLYAAGSKNVYCRCFGTVGMHGGINFNMLESKDDNNPNFYLGLDRSLWKWFSAAVEYNFAMNDDDNDAYGNGGYVSGLFRYSHSSGWTLEFLFIDFASENKFTEEETRAVRFIFPLEVKNY